MSCFHVLLIDESKEQLEIIEQARSLLSFPFEVHQLADVSEVEMWLGEREKASPSSDEPSIGIDEVSLVLLAYELPGASGSELVGALRRYTNAPIIVLFDETTPEQSSACYRVGASTCLERMNTVPQCAEALVSLHAYWHTFARSEHVGLGVMTQ